MGVIKTLTTIAILFVAFNLVMTIYNSINRAWRERFENPPHLRPAVNQNHPSQVQTAAHLPQQHH